MRVGSRLGMAIWRRECLSCAAVQAAFGATGAEDWVTHYTALLARACEIAGQIEEAMTQLDDALRIVGKDR